MIKDLPEGQTQYEGTGGPSELSAGFGGVSPAPTFEDELLDLLAMMFDAYEDGPDCYEDPEDCSGHIGKAIHLDDDAFQRIADILNEHRPRVTPNDQVQP